jgi:hypothetical protein
MRERASESGCQDECNAGDILYMRMEFFELGIHQMHQPCCRGSQRLCLEAETIVQPR